MDPEQNDTIESRMQRQNEHPVLALRCEESTGVLRYAVGVSDTPPPMYSVYAECIIDGKITAESIPAFSRDRDTAESFCALLARFSATPLSLHAIYEDSLTP